MRLRSVWSNHSKKKIYIYIFVHTAVVEKLWRVRPDSIGWLWHVHSTCSQGWYRLIHVKLLFCFGALSVLNRVLCWVGHNCFGVPSLPPILHEKKHHGWHIFDTVHLFCLWTMNFKEGQDASIAKCVPNKWYPSQNGSSLENVLAKGSKSMGLCQHPSSFHAGTHSRGTDGLSWLGSSKGLWPWASRLLGELEAPLGPLSEWR